MNTEEQAAYDREVQRCLALRRQLNSLKGDAAAAAAVDRAYEPLRAFVPPSPTCRLPYEAPELVP
jgi:hypothetical protein